MPLDLPPLCVFSGAAEDWPAYEDELYAHFRRDVVERQPPLRFRGRPVGIRREPADKGKEYAFWHITSYGMSEEARVPDLRRCERIRWPAALLLADEADRVVWEEPPKGQYTHLGVALPDFSYVVFLREWPYSYQLLTAYAVEREHIRAKYRSHWEARKR